MQIIISFLLGMASFSVLGQSMNALECGRAVFTFVRSRVRVSDHVTFQDVVRVGFVIAYCAGEPRGTFTVVSCGHRNKELGFRVV